jgi:MFS family permease
MSKIKEHISHDLKHAKEVAHNARKGILPWLYWGIAAVFYLYEFFARVAPSTFEWKLQDTFSLNASELGFVMGLYYLAYAPMQLVVGIALDRFGSKRLLSLAAIIAGLGCLIFALAGNVFTLGLGRIMLGIGSSCAYVGAVYVATVWFPRRRLALIMGMTAALGTIGAALGEAPLREAIEKYGATEAMYTAAFGGLVIANLIFFIVPRRPDWFLHLVKLENPEPRDTMFKGLREVLSNKQTWLVAIISLLLYVPISTFGALWGISYVSTSAGVPIESAAWAMTMLFLGFAAGGPLLGLLSDKFNFRRLPILIGGGLCTFSMGMLLLAPNLPFSVTVFFLISTGFFAGAQAITFAVAVEQHGKYCRATAVAFVNFFVMLGGFLLQPAFGAVLDSTSSSSIYTETDYQKALVLLPVSILIGTVFSFWLKETSEQ